MDSCLTIRKQTIVKTLPAPFTDSVSWTTDIVTQNNAGEVRSVWKMEAIFNHRDDATWFTLRGTSQSNNFRNYNKSYCKVVMETSTPVLYKTMLLSYEGSLRAPNYFWFNFAAICNLQTLFDNHGLNPKEVQEIDLTITMGIVEEEIVIPLNCERLLNENILTDFAIVTAEKRFQCHKFVLAARSNYFQAMFETRMKERYQNELDWVEVFSAKTVKDLLYFMYTGKSPDNLDQTCYELMEASQLCLIDGLKELCANRMKTMLNSENAAIIWQVAERHELERLKLAAVKFVASNGEQVTNSEAWQKIPNDMAPKLLISVVKAIPDIAILKI